MQSTSSQRVIERGRLRRAWNAVIQGRVTHLGESQYRVVGSGLTKYYVDLSEDIPCYCSDSQHRGDKMTCYHTLGALLMAQDEPTLIAAGEMLLNRANHDTANRLA